MLYPGPYPDKTGSYLAAVLPEAVAAGAYAYDDGSGLIQLFWPEGEPPSVATVEAWGPAPVTDVERMASLFSQAQAGAPAYLNQLKGAVWVALVAAGMSEADATAAGVDLVLRHAAPLAAFESAGGHPVAAAALYAAISSPESVAALPWLTAPILAIFQAALAPA